MEARFLGFAVHSFLLGLLFGGAVWLFRVRNVSLRYTTGCLVLPAVLILPTRSIVAQTINISEGDENYARHLGLLYAGAILTANQQSMDRDPAGARAPEASRVQFETAVKEIRHLPPYAFPDLPAKIKAVLSRRGCLVPQPMLDGQPRNVIRGEFFDKGQIAWAVLCSTGGFSSILVFRGDSDTRPEELARKEDKIYLQDVGEGKIAYSHEIQTVDRKFIMTHYRAYGGPEPPPINHHGIDDAFLEKASETHYWYNRKWLLLQGSD